MSLGRVNDMSVLGKLKRHFAQACARAGGYVNEKCSKLSLAFFGAGSLVAAYEGLVDLPNYLLGVGGAGLAVGAALLSANKPKLAGTSLLLANATLIINGGSLALSADSAGVMGAGLLLAFGNLVYAAANSELLTGFKAVLSHAHNSGIASASLLTAGLFLNDSFLLTSAGLFVLDAITRSLQDKASPRAQALPAPAPEA